MTWPTSKWLSVVLAIILVTEVWATTGSTGDDDSSYQQATGGGGVENAANYDVLDVAKHTQSQQIQKSTEPLNKMLTGQTTRILLSGDIDDDFWLKHLGDDYHHAVHLMVGGRHDPQNPYRGPHTMNAGLYNVNPDRDPRYGARSYINPEYHASEVNVQPLAPQTYGNIQRMSDTVSSDFQASDNKPEQQQTYETPEYANETPPKEYPVERTENVEYSAPAESISSTTESNDATPTPHADNTNETPIQPAIEVEPNNDQNLSPQQVNADAPVTHKPHVEEKSYEQMFALGDKLANKFFNPNSFNIPDMKPHKNLHYTDSLQKYHTHTKYSPTLDTRTEYTDHTDRNDHNDHNDHTEHKDLTDHTDHTAQKEHTDHTEHKYTETEQDPTLNTKSTSTSTSTDDREYSGDGDQLSENNFSRNPHQKPVVISLPDTAKSMVQQLSDSVTPVVVKVPPVIYHEKANKYYRTSKGKLNKLYTSTTSQNTQQQTLPYPHIYSDYYNPIQTQDPQEYPQQLQDYSQQQQDYSQQQQQQEYPQQLQEYPQQQQPQQDQLTQPLAMPEHQHQQQLAYPQIYAQYQNSYYNPITANSYDPSAYTGHSLYSPASQVPSEETVNSIPDLRYIFGKASLPQIASYPDLQKQLQTSSADPNLYDGYTRVSRSYRQFFYDGL